VGLATPNWRPPASTMYDRWKDEGCEDNVIDTLAGERMLSDMKHDQLESVRYRSHTGILATVSLMPSVCATRGRARPSDDKLV